MPSPQDGSESSVAGDFNAYEEFLGLARKGVRRILIVTTNTRYIIYPMSGPKDRSVEVEVSVARPKNVKGGGYIYPSDPDALTLWCRRKQGMHEITGILRIRQI
jgi:hypothetical protein